MKIDGKDIWRQKSCGGEDLDIKGILVSFDSGFLIMAGKPRQDLQCVEKKLTMLGERCDGIWHYLAGKQTQDVEFKNSLQ